MKEQRNNQIVSTMEIVSNINFVLRYLYKTNKKLFFVRLPLLLLQTASSLVNVYLLGNIINELTSNRSIETVMFLTITFAVANFLISALQKVISKYDKYEHERTILGTRYHLGRTIAEMPLSVIEQPRLKNLVALAQDTNSLPRIIDGLTDFFGAVIGLITYSSVVFVVQPWIVILIAASLILQVVINKIKLNLENKWRIIQMPTFRKLWYYESLLYDARCGKELRVNVLKDWILNRIYAIYEKECTPIVKESVYQGNALDFFIQLFRIAENIAIYILLTYKVVFENMKIGDFSFYLASTFKLATVFSNLNDSISNLSESGMFAKEFRFCIELSKELRDMSENRKIDDTRDLSLEFVNVSFKYPNTDDMVLKNVSFKINAGETLSLVGINGAGKSTLVKLICRFYESTEGSILLNEVNIHDYSIDEYSQLLSVVFQDYKLFSFSVLENVTMGTEVDENLFERSIKESGLSEKIASLPDKENTFVYKDFDERGVEFSGGEGQKLAICRALYKNSPVVILDEPTAALDPIAEYEMYRRFDNVVKGKMAIYISHRLSCTRFTDKVAVLHNGRLCEYGSHSELMKRENGIYREMFNIQASKYA